MPLTLYVDGNRWRDHLTGVVEREPGLVPVVKGNGYGFGLGRLARRATWLERDTIAVGTYAEVAAVEKRFPGSVLVLSPWRPTVATPLLDRMVHTVGRLEDLRDLQTRGASEGVRPRIVLELVTSMLRHGFTAAGLREAGRALTGCRLEGVALHLPLAADQVGADTRRFPCSLLLTRSRRSPTLPQRPRHGYAAALHRGLPKRGFHRPRKFVAPHPHRGRRRTAPGPYPSGLNR